MEIAISGEGEMILRFIDKNGLTLMQERLTVSGSPKTEALRVVALSLQTTEGETALAPVLVSQSNPKQRVRFDDEPPSRFTQKRCKEIGCAAKIAADAARGIASPPVPGSQPSLTDDAALLQRLLAPTAR